MVNTRKPALRSVLAQDGTLVALDAQEFRDGSGSISYSDIFEQSPALQKEIADAEAERRRARDCNRFGSTSGSGKDRATIQTSRKDVTRTGVR
jgi:hypothetical protein